MVFHRHFDLAENRYRNGSRQHFFSSFFFPKAIMRVLCLQDVSNSDMSDAMRDDFAYQDVLNCNENARS